MPASTNANHNLPVLPRALLVVAGLAGLVFLLAHFCLRVKPALPEASGATPSQAESIPSVATVPETAEVSLGLRKGDRLVYEFHQERSIEIRGSSFGGAVTKGATNQSVAMQLVQAGDLIVNVYDENLKGWTVGFAVERATLKMSSGERVAPSDGSEAGLRSEVLVFVEKSGRIGKMTAPANVSPETLNHWRDILSRWQTVLASDAAARTWKRTEEDSTGTYVALYSRESAQTPASVRKQKQQYLSVHGASQKGFEARCKVNGTTVIELAPYQTSIEGHDQLTLLTPEIGGSINSEADYSFQLRKAAQETEVVAFGAEMARQLAGGRSFSWASTKAAGNQSGTVDVSKTTIEEQLANLDALLAEGKHGTTAELKILEKIVALIKKDDSAVDAIVSRLSNPKSPQENELSSALIGMLGAAGTPKSQETLIGIVNTTEWPLEQRQMAIFSFAQVTEPTPAVDSWLQQLHKEDGDLANNSLLVLAAMGDRVREQSPERFNQISQYVIGAASTPGLAIDERVVGLDAIGNLGPQEVPQVVRDALAGEDALLREKALVSLQRMDCDTTTPMVRNALQSDSADSVRAVAANLLGDTRRTGGCEDLCQAALKDTSENVRAAASKSLGGWMDADPEARRVLQQVASQDASQDVRKIANQMLHSQDGFEAGEAIAAAR